MDNDSKIYHEGGLKEALKFVGSKAEALKIVGLKATKKIIR